LIYCEFSDLSYRFLIDSEIFCPNLFVFNIPEIIGRNPFPTFPFFDSDQTKNYTGENSERVFPTVFIPLWVVPG
ncbi:hypothetical protein Zm00014a_026925, partial [Zea mays]